jgi:adenosylhomocysteine nucleosidase
MKGARVAIFAALPWECRAAVRSLHAVDRHRVGSFVSWRGSAAGRNVWVVRTGVGEARAARAARLLTEATKPDLFISTGCAGALRADLAAGDLVIATTLACLRSAERIAVDAGPRNLLRRAAADAGVPSSLGPIACSDGVLATREEREAVAASSGAIAVEMEGAGIAAEARAAGIPLVAVRAILDPIDADLGVPGTMLDPETGRVRVGAFLRHVASDGNALPRLRALHRMMGAARSSLERLCTALWAKEWGESQA